MCQTCVRTPIKVDRQPVTYFTENRIYNGGWFAFPKPDEEPPTPTKKLKNSERILWCPWCGEWTVYKKISHTDRWECKGVCGWANTDEWYVKTYNKIWWEGVPLKEIQKITIPAPAKRKR